MWELSNKKAQKMLILGGFAVLSSVLYYIYQSFLLHIFPGECGSLPDSKCFGFFLQFILLIVAITMNALFFFYVIAHIFLNKKESKNIAMLAFLILSILLISFSIFTFYILAQSTY